MKILAETSFAASPALVLPTARLELTKAGNPSEPEPAEAVFRLDVHQWLMSRAAWLRAALDRFRECAGLWIDGYPRISETGTSLADIQTDMPNPWI